MTRIMDIIERDANIDNIVILMWLGMGGFGPGQPTGGANREDEIPGGPESVIALRKKTSKPVLAVVNVLFAPAGVEDKTHFSVM